MIVASGARGMLGRYFDPGVVLKTDLEDLDVTDGAAVRRFLAEHRPTVFLHLAALTDVDRCQLEPSLAHRVNVDGTRVVAEACAEAGCAVVYMSTAQVFAGDKPTAYVESDEVGPVNVYGETKCLGEEVVRQTVAQHYIVRTSWLMGGGPGTDKKFIGKLLELLETQTQLRAVADKRGCPTYARDLADTLLALVETGRPGTYHVANGGVATRYDLARALVAHAGREVPVAAVPSSEFPLPAPRPDSEVLESEALPLAGLSPLRDWEQALSAYLAEWDL